MQKPNAKRLSRPVPPAPNVGDELALALLWRLVMTRCEWSQSANGQVEIEDIQSDIGTGAARETCMKAFLLFLILGGAALYTFLVVTHDSLQDGKTETTLAVQTQPNQPVADQVSSWGTYLSQKPEAPLAQQTAALPPQPSPSQDLERLPGADHQLAASEDEAATTKATPIKSRLS